MRPHRGRTAPSAPSDRDGSGNYSFAVPSTLSNGVTLKVVESTPVALEIVYTTLDGLNDPPGEPTAV